MHRLLVVAGLAMFAESAAASPCNTSDDDSSSDDWSSDDSSDDTSSDPTPGRATQLPPMLVEVGLATRTFASSLGTETGSVTHDAQSFSYRVVGPESRTQLETAVVGQLRVGAPMRHGLYVAGELELGALTGATVATEMTSSGALGRPTLTPTSVMVIGGVGVAGVGGRIGAVDLGVEVAGGIRALAYNFDSTYLACETTSTITTTSPVLEGRARAAVWLTPFVSLSAIAGKSALDSGVVGGLSIGFTNHAFAGR